MQFTKILFLVLLGTALVLSNPIPEADNSEVAVPAAIEQKVEDVVDDKSDELEIDLPIDLDSEEDASSTEATHHKKKGSKFVNKIVHFFDKAKKNLTIAKDTTKASYKKIKSNYKLIKKEITELLKQMNTTYKEVKAAGKKAIADYKKIKAEFVSTWNTLSKAGEESYKEIVTAIQETKKQLKNIKSSVSEDK